MSPPAPDPPAAAGPRLDADRHVAVAADRIAGVLARAVALGLTDLGLLAPAGDGVDEWLETARAAAALAPLRVRCGLLVAADGSTGPDRSRLSRVDFVLVHAGPGGGAAALHAAAGLRLPVVLAGPVLADLPAGALVRAGVTAAVTERDRTPSVEVARALCAAGVPLVAGSAARDASGVGRWQHVRTVAAALSVPGPPATRTRTAPEPHLLPHPVPRTVIPASTEPTREHS